MRWRPILVSLQNVSVLLGLSLVASGAEPNLVVVEDQTSGFSIRLPADWQATQISGMPGYQDPAHREYAFWTAGGRVNAARLGAGSKDEVDPAELLRSMIAENPVKPELMREESLTAERALAFYRATRGAADGNTQYSWTLVEKSDGDLWIGLFTFSVIDAKADPSTTEGLLGLLWESISDASRRKN